MKGWLSANGSLVEAILRHLDTPVSLATWLLFQAQEWDQLASRWVDPREYPEGIFSSLRYEKDVQAVDLLRKAPLPTTFSRRSNALQAWEDAESACFQTNEYVSRILFSCRVTPVEKRHAEFLRAVQRRLARWLGPIPDDLEGGFGPGTCVEYQGSNPTVVDKLWLTPTTTPDAADIFSLLHFRTRWGFERVRGSLALPGLSRGNRLTTVPKDGKVDRPISIEPLGNLWLQLGIGRYMKRRLLQVGLPRFSETRREIFPGLEVAYEDAQSVHRRLASLGRSSGLSTVDLTSASDTISLELVRACFPPDWFELMDSCRSKLTEAPNSVGGKAFRHLEKFSSMGNGFTFELETFLFLALLSVAFELVPGKDLWVFGDDIILPTERFDAACNLLSTFGFTPNKRKSYRDGPFRESCGGNYHTGRDVTPVRVTGPLETVAQWYALHNALRRRGFSSSVLRIVRSRIPLKLQCPGPERLGDAVLHSARYPRRSLNGVSWVRILSGRPEDRIPLERWEPQLAVVSLLLGSTSKVTRRGCKVSPITKWASVS